MKKTLKPTVGLIELYMDIVFNNGHTGFPPNLLEDVRELFTRLFFRVKAHPFLHYAFPRDLYFKGHKVGVRYDLYVSPYEKYRPLIEKGKQMFDDPSPFISDLIWTSDEIFKNLTEEMRKIDIRMEAVMMVGRKIKGHLKQTTMLPPVILHMTHTPNPNEAPRPRLTTVHFV